MIPNPELVLFLEDVRRYWAESEDAERDTHIALAVLHGLTERLKERQTRKKLLGKSLRSRGLWLRETGCENRLDTFHRRQRTASVQEEMEK